MGRHATGSQASFHAITVYYSQYLNCISTSVVLTRKARGDARCFSLHVRPL